MLIKYNRVKVSMIKKVEMRGSECVLWYKDVLAHSMEERYMRLEGAVSAGRCAYKGWERYNKML
jgi:hypothetical protein